MRFLDSLSVVAVLAAASTGCSPEAATEPFDLVLEGGEVVDGTGAPARRADVGIRGDAIAAVGDLSESSAERTVDVSGLVVSPGFIDMHSHSDFTLLVDGRGLSKITQGVTTELLGESGSAAPVEGEAVAEMERRLAELDLELQWRSLGEYFDVIERSGTSLNVTTTVGTGQLRASVVGYDDRPATVEEMVRMEELVEEAMRDGAIGVSSGLIYPPNAYASTEELIALSKVAAEYGGIYLTHMRGESDDLLEALGEAIRIGKESGAAVEVLHFKRSGVRLEGETESPTIQDAVALIERARSQGVTVYANLYPYEASQTTLGIQLPDWVHDGGRQAMLARLRDPEMRARIRGEIAEELSRGIAGSTPETILFGSTTYGDHRRYQGERISEIAEAMGVEPAEAIIELIDKADGSTRAIYFGMRDEDVRYLLGLDWTTIGSDGTAVAPSGVLARSHPHPRWYGSFPRVLGHYVREEGVISLEDAVRKMTSLAAQRIGVADRGVIAEGMKADIVAFDPDTIIDRSTFIDPHQLSEGVEWVLVNGEVVLEKGEHTGAMPGRVLRGAGYVEPAS
jgi:N-acyl-D-aspartate/D-glutamate deacylase